MKGYKLAIVLLFSFTTLIAQQQEDVENANPVFELNFGKSSDNKFTKSKPAQLMVTNRNDTIPNSYLINGFVESALSWERQDNFSYAFGLIYEVQKNTLIKKEQDVRQFGVTAKQTFANNYEDTKWQLIVSQSLKKSEDREKKTKAFQGHLGIKYEDFRNKSIFNVDGPIPLLGPKDNRDKFLSFRWDYDLGLGYIGGDEKVLFGKASFFINTFPLYGVMKDWFKQPELLFASFKIESRAAFIGDTQLDVNPLRTFSTGISYVINDANKFSLAYSWNKGANPFAGLATQEFRTLTIQFVMSLDTGK